MHKVWKDFFLKMPCCQEAWGMLRRWQLHKDYVTRRESYEKKVQHGGLIYREAETIKAIRSRLNERGHSSQPKKEGEIHTAAFVPDLMWHKHLLPDLRTLGPLTVFDYVSKGFKIEKFAKADREGLARRRAMNDWFFSTLRQVHEDHPVDWIFVYASGTEISASTIRRITDELGIPTVNMCLDDKHCWNGRWMGDHPAGQVGIASVFDISWTSARVAREWYLVEGGRPIYMPEGIDASFYRPMPVDQNIPISFIGGAYGYRPSVISHLRRHGLPIQTFGQGWPKGTWADDIVEIFNRSRINLGMGGIGYSENLTNVKGRDFEIPGTGGGVYLTSFNPDLAQHFVIGEEILCYRNRDELVELVRHYIKNPGEAQTIARRGFERCIREHRWLHRYQRLLRILGIIEADQ